MVFAGLTDRIVLVPPHWDNLLVRKFLIIVMIRWTGFVPWEFDLFFL